MSAKSQFSAPPLDNSLLKGKVTATQSPLLQGSVQTIAPGTEVHLNLSGNLNSELSQKGDEVLARISVDVRDGDKVLLPGGWFVHGYVTDAGSQRRLGRDGHVSVEFDRIISPQGDIELPFGAKFSTKDSQLKSIAKVVAIDSGYVGAGAFAGALLSVQMTGLPVAIGTNGYSVAIGAGVGATIGAVGALKRKGKIAAFYPGDELKLKVTEPITMPGFDPTAIPSAVKPKELKGLEITIIGKPRFKKDEHSGDAHSRLLVVDLLLDNHAKTPVSFMDLAVVSEHNQRYYPTFGVDFKKWNQRVEPGSIEQATMTFSVDSPKKKYWIVLLDRATKEELNRVPVNKPDSEDKTESTAVKAKEADKGSRLETY